MLSTKYLDGFRAIILFDCMHLREVAPEGSALVLGVATIKYHCLIKCVVSICIHFAWMLWFRYVSRIPCHSAYARYYRTSQWVTAQVVEISRITPECSHNYWRFSKPRKWALPKNKLQTVFHACAVSHRFCAVTHSVCWMTWNTWSIFKVS